MEKKKVELSPNCGAPIDQLPEVLFQKILSSLPTKTAISTSVLSKEWRSRWKSLGKLKFDSEDYECEVQEFGDVVHESLLSLEGPVLESFHLRFGLDKAHPEDVGEWVRYAYSRHLRKLVLEFHDTYDEEYFTFSSSLCTDVLETLKLRNLIIVDFPEAVTMKSLKMLELSYVFFTSDKSINNLLSGCPRLEELVVLRTDEYGVTIFTIQVPSLQRLTIYDDNSIKEFLGYTIDAPSLEYLKIGELYCPRFSLNAPKLVEAYIAGVESETTHEFRKTLASVKRLFLDESPFEITEAITGSIFIQLVYLEMYTCVSDWWDLLTPMLEHSPKLQVLKLVGQCTRFLKVCGLEWNKPQYVPECLLSHLETLVWTRYDWENDKHEEVATYILENARRLKKATFSINAIAPNKLNKLNKRRKKLNGLAAVVKASNSCHLVFKFERTLFYT